MIHSINYEIRENIIKRCKNKKISPYKVALSAGISKAIMHNLLNNLEYNVSIHTLEKIAEVLELEFIELFI